MTDEVYLYSDKCRLCLSNEKFKIPIFGEAAQEMQIFQKIKTCLPIKVSPEDDFPKNICYKCVAALEQSYNLWSMSSQSEAVLKHLTSEADEEVSEANMQHQVCKLHSEDNYKTVSQISGGRSFSQANRRRLQPTLTSHILESGSEEELELGAEMDLLKTQRAAGHMGQEPTPWPWDDNTVMMDTSPDLLDLLSEPSPCSFRETSQAEAVNSSPDILESLTQPATSIRDVTTKGSSPSSRWRSMNLFSKSADTWRDLFIHREAKEDRERVPGTWSIITEGATAIPQTVDSRMYEDVLKAKNECNYEATSQCGDTPSALNFLCVQKPLVHEDLDIQQQGPK